MLLCFVLYRLFDYHLNLGMIYFFSEIDHPHDKYYSSPIFHYAGGAGALI